MPFLSDTHCHLYMQDFDNDIETVLSKAYSEGLRKILVPGIDLETSRKAISLREKSPNLLFPAVGIHPNYAKNPGHSEISEIEYLAANPEVVAIGEIGLDFFRERAPIEDQKFVFQEMLRISKDMKKPICIHNRDADLELIALLEPWYSSLMSSHSDLAAYPGVFHSYSGSEIISNWAIMHNFFLGITGPVTYKKSLELKKQIEQIDISHLVIETDAPFLSPHPYRGKRNEPEYIKYIAEEIALIKKMEVEDVVKSTSENARNLFKWGE